MKKKLIIAVLVLAGVGTLMTGGYLTWLRTPPAMPTTAEGAADTLMSERFRRLPAERKLAYMERVRELIRGMSAEERRAFFERYRGDDEFFRAAREAMMEMAVERARQFAEAPPQQRAAMLDEVIDRFSGFGRGGGPGRFGPGGMRGGPPGGPDDGNGRPGGFQRPDPETMTDEQRAELQQRREQRMQQMVGRMGERAATGNPQDEALLHEFGMALRHRMQERGMDFGRGGRGGGSTANDRGDRRP